MNLLKPDSPVMNLLSTIADLIVLHLLFVICCLPIVTIGAAYSAKYYVAMKIIRGEDSGVFAPFFKAFIRNFKRIIGCTPNKWRMDEEYAKNKFMKYNVTALKGWL